MLTALLILTLLQTPDKNYQSVVFESFTRGGNRSITISRDSVIIADNDNTTRTKVAAADWKEIVAALDKLQLDQIATYPAPSSGRASDAAWHSSISVIANGKTYSSTSFDDEKAPKQLSGLMTCIKEIQKQYTQK